MSIIDVAAWMRSNRLLLNAAKTKLVIRYNTIESLTWTRKLSSLVCVCHGYRQDQLPDVPFTVGSSRFPVFAIWAFSWVQCRRLRETSCLSCFISLRQIRSIQRSVKQTSAAVTGHVTNYAKARLQECHTSRGPCISDRSTPVNTPHCSTFGEWLAQVRPRLLLS